jgi:hypothetical protein
MRTRRQNDEAGDAAALTQNDFGESGQEVQIGEESREESASYHS